MPRLNKTFQHRKFPNYYFRFISRCPASWNGQSQDETKRCENGGNRFENIVPVSSRTGEKLFKNRYCTMCHGFYDVVDWKLSILSDCLSTINKMFANQSERETNILRSCFIYSLPPSNFYGDTVASNLHKSRYVSKCAGFQSNYPAVESKCAAPSSTHNSYYLYRVISIPVFIHL